MVRRGPRAARQFGMIVFRPRTASPRPTAYPSCDPRARHTKARPPDRGSGAPD